jgi:hypothetical protein
MVGKTNKINRETVTNKGVKETNIQITERGMIFLVIFDGH